MSASLRPRDLMAEPRPVRGAWKARVITLFPDAFPGVLGQSLTGKALDLGLWALDTIDLRPFGMGKHRNVDDTPAGGGAGMVLRADVLDAALGHAAQGTPDRARWPVIYLSPRGRPFDQAMARRLAACDGVTLLCGRFEGVDDRVLQHHAIEEVSLGDFVMTGGEIAAQAVLDATVRLLPGVLGNAESAVEESFSNGLLEHPQYTRPTEWKGLTIPDVLQSGNHAAIAKWRHEQAEAITRERRPDLWASIETRSLPPEVAAVSDKAGFLVFAEAVFKGPSAQNSAEQAIECMIACLQSNHSLRTLPQNPWRAAALLLFMGAIYK